jgi:dimethylhistidine N-methyltransferase
MKIRSEDGIELHDMEPESGSMREEVLSGLSRRPRHLSPKFLYDERGARLFEEITQLEEYYPTRTEVAILREHLPEMAERLGAESTIVEFGSGSGRKTRHLLDALDRPSVYVPIDISREQLLRSSRRLASAYPDIQIVPVCADYTSSFELPEAARSGRRATVFFPGSTIGNFERRAAVEFLRRVAGVVGEGGGLLIGVDLHKSPDILVPAYNDASGVTADFNLNLLRHINRELDANFDLEGFYHTAIYDLEQRRIEMRLVSERAQVVRIGGEVFEFEPGEHIVTEYSHKYSPEGFEQLAGEAGFEVEQVWFDEERLFSIQYLRS